MSAPKRWLDDAGGASDLEREVLEAGVGVDPPAGAQAEVWTSLLAKLPPPGGSPPDPGGATGGAKLATAKAAAAGKAAGAAVSGGIVKSALIGAGSALALVATYTAVVPSTSDPPAAPTVAASSSTEPSKATAPAPLGAAPTTTATAAPTAEPSAEPVTDRRATPEPRPVSTAAAATATPSAVPAAAERETQLREESRMVGEARDALRRGDAGEALAKLEQLRARFPGGVLAQEREALAIEALSRSGRRDEARARAAAFVKAYPASPLAVRVQGFAN